MKVLLVGTGGVGEAIAIAAKGRPFLERMVLADYDLDRAHDPYLERTAAFDYPWGMKEMEPRAG